MSEARGTLDVGRVLSETFGLWAKLLGPLLLMSFVVHLPLIGYTVHVAFNDLSQATLELLTLVEVGGGVVLGFLLVGAITYMVVEHIAGRRRSVGVVLAMGLRSLPGVFWVSHTLTSVKCGRYCRKAGVKGGGSSNWAAH